MAYKAVVASSLMLGVAQGHIFSSWSTRTQTTTNNIVEVPAAGGTRPVAAFGIATGNVSSRIIFYNLDGEDEGSGEAGEERPGGTDVLACMHERWWLSLSTGRGLVCVFFHWDSNKGRRDPFLFSCPSLFRPTKHRLTHAFPSPLLHPSLPPSKQYAADTIVDFKAYATLSGGMFIKGFAFPKVKHDEFVAACTKPEDGLVSVYEWGYGPCDNFMTALKAQVPAAVTFNAATALKDGGGSTVTANFTLTAASEGLFVMFENLMGQPVTFSNAEFSILNVAAPVKAEEDLVFPAATVHMSAVVVKLADETPTEKTLVSFNAKGTAPTGAKPTAMMVVNKEQMAPERLGCTFGFYFGWFKMNTAGQNVCKQADFSYTMDGDILKLTG